MGGQVEPRMIKRTGLQVAPAVGSGPVMTVVSTGANVLCYGFQGRKSMGERTAQRLFGSRGEEK